MAQRLPLPVGRARRVHSGDRIRDRLLGDIRGRDPHLGSQGGRDPEAPRPGDRVSTRLSLFISVLLVALSYGLVRGTLISANLDVFAVTYLPVSVSLFFIGLFVMVSRRMALNQVVGLLIMENGLFLFTTALTQGVSLIIEVGILADIVIGVMISALLLLRMSQTFDSFDIASLENLKDD
jgi:hydrogenase-4 component E